MIKSTAISFYYRKKIFTKLILIEYATTPRSHKLPCHQYRERLQLQNTNSVPDNVGMTIIPETIRLCCIVWLVVVVRLTVTPQR